MLPYTHSEDATMSQRTRAASIILCFFALFTAAAVRAADASAPRHLTAKEIVANNAKARGGLEAWRKVTTMVLIGYLETGNPSVPRVPFVLQQARPNKTRFEVHMHQKTSVRIFNGVEGWKLRPSRGAGPEPLAYTPEEIQAARDGPGIDGPLLDYQAKRIGIAFDGTDDVAGKKAYRLIVKLPSGATRRWWVDAVSFLDLKYERESRTTTGQPATVTVNFANYKSVEGLQIPHSITTGQGSGKPLEAMMIEEVFLNRPMGDKVFSQPSSTGMKSTNPIPWAH
jgi:hypothetical protein